MPTNYIALAIPFFFVCIGAELFAAWRMRRRVYRFADAITDLGCGIQSELSKLFLHGVMIAGYLWLYEHHRLVDPRPGALWPWLVAFVGVDFIYYWWHRLSHEVNFLWAAHVVHHTSEDYNLAVALRQAIATNVTVIPFYLPLALAGVPPVVYVTIHSFNTLYQFWIHTELVGKLGAAEAVLNTPSHHRVHHAINPRYLDRNYAGTLIVWDRLFGTFVEEQPDEEPPVYGTVKPLASYNPLRAQFHYFGDLLRATVRAPIWADKLRVWVASPAWHPRWLPAGPTSDGVTPATFRKYDPRPTQAQAIYVGLWFAAATALATVLIFEQGSWPSGRLAAGSAVVVMTLMSAGAICEGRRWAWPFEGLRLVAVAALVIAWLPLL